jgi:hypothetical protein
MGLTKKPQKANFTLLTEPVDRIFLGNTDFLVSPISFNNNNNNNNTPHKPDMAIMTAAA